MNFRQFLERDDLPTIHQFHNDAEQVFNDLVSYYEDYWESNFPKRTRGQDDNDYIREIRRRSEQWQYKIPQIYGHKVIIQAPSKNNWAGKAGQDLKGEMSGTSIIIYLPIYVSFNNDVKWYSNAYISAWIDRKPRKAANAKREAKISYAFMSQLKQQKDEIIDILFHEISHAARHSHIKDPTIPAHLATQGRILRTYVNNPPELDAHFLEKAFRVLKEKQPYNSFSDFVTYRRASPAAWVVRRLAV